MKKLFPEMFDRPDKGIPFTCAIYIFVFSVLIPFVVLILIQGLADNLKAISWFDIAYYGFNFICILGLFHRYLAESFFNVRMNVRNVVITAITCVALILVCEAVYLGLSFFNIAEGTFSAMPLSETSVLADSSVIVVKNPVFGTLCVTLLTPITVSCLYYGGFFAPVCVEKGGVAYLVVAVVLLIPRLFNIWWLENVDNELKLYLLQLPIHLIACWGYQKTDTIWTPICSIAIANLIVSAAMLAMDAAGLIYIR